MTGSSKKSVMMARWNRVDKPLFWLGLAASLLGVFFIFLASYPKSIAKGAGPVSRETIMQSAFLIAGLAAWYFASGRKYEFWLRSAKVAWFVTFIGLIACKWSPLALEQNGASRWINLKFVTIQPAEFAKITGILYIAAVLVRREMNKGRVWVPKFGGASLKKLFRSNVFRYMPAIWVTLAFVLISIEPDLGTAAVLGFSGYFMFCLGGISKRSIVWGTAIVLCLLGAVAALETYRIERFMSHFSRWESHNVDDIGFQTVQSELAMASGSVVGVGVGNGRAKHILPAATTDFVSTTIAEELGYVGWIAILGLMAALTYRLFTLSMVAPTKLGKLVLMGVGLWIGIQSFTNLMMANGVLPPIGIPLPFISYGGSSLVALWLALGICQSLLRPHLAIVKDEVSSEEEEVDETHHHRWRDRRTRLSGSGSSSLL